MTTRHVLCAAALAALALAPTPASAGSEGRINGIIVDQDGKPLEGVSVTVEAQEVEMVRTAETNRKGRFNLVVLDATRTFEITLEKEGYITITEPINPKIGDLLKKEWRMVAVDRLTEESREQLAAVEALNRAARSYNDGVKAFNEGDFEAAEAAWRAALDETEEPLPVANLGLARIYREREAWEQAASEAGVAAQQMPEEPLGYLIHFDALWELGRQDEAKEVVDRLAKIDQSRPTAVRVFEVGVAEIRADELDAARERFDQVIEMAPDIKEAHINLGHIHRAQGNFEEVKRHAEAYLALEPEGPSALSLLYQAEQALGNEEASEAAFARLTASDPELVTRTFYEEGTTLFNSGQPAAAKQAFERVLAADAEHAGAHYYLGLYYAGAEEPVKAKEYLTRFLELAPEHPEAPAARAMLEYYE